MIRKISISKPDMGKEEWQALKEPILSGWLTEGPKVKEFEKLFAKRHKVTYAYATSNCTTALHVALLALGIGPGDEVMIPAFTWVSTANAVLYCGAKPVFIDIDLNTFNIDPKLIKKKLTKKTKAIIPVHLFGLCADIDAIKQQAPHLKIVEDGACAAGAGYMGRPAGSLGDIGCFSFHPRKSITTGEGGMVTTNVKLIGKRINSLRNHGSSISEEERHIGSKPYLLPEFNIVGYNYRMTDLQGALGIVQIKKLDKFIDERKKKADYYSEKLKDIDWLITPKTPKGYRHGWQAYVCLVNEKKSPTKRNEIMEILHKNGIATRPGTHAVHMLGYYKNTYRIKASDFPQSQTANDKSIALPLHNKMTKVDLDYVITALKNI
jgi:perosamine synthetase